MVTTAAEVECYHCGNVCSEKVIYQDEKVFCCHGCETVYELLAHNNLCNYYDLEIHPGIKSVDHTNSIFNYLDNNEIKDQIIDFTDGNITKVTFYVPTIHCSSCIWLLEKLYSLDQGITESRVDFLKKLVFITFRNNETSLKTLAILLTSIGYEPLISLNDVVKEKKSHQQNALIKRLALAGFCSANIMMFSLPEYFGLDSLSHEFSYLFTYINLFLSLPVLVYCADIYFISVYKSLLKGILNIDLPILIGLLTTFGRSVYEVLSHTGTGYFDSFSGLVFFLLIGRWFQQKTYSFLSFERDYKSYFPMAVNKLELDEERPVSATSLKKGDKIRVRNNELIPADALLFKGYGNIDYSFVTGEIDPISKKPGELLYAGGRQLGDFIDLEIIKEVSQSYLTQLWNKPDHEKEKVSGYKTFADHVGKYFTIIILAIATLVATYWYFADPSKILNAFTAILIIACPCALALSYPMALGNVMRNFGEDQFYLKNADVVEKMAQADTIVFDKTGTITGTDAKMDFIGEPLSFVEKCFVASLVKRSSHPLSKQIFKNLRYSTPMGVSEYNEIVGKGLEGNVLNEKIKLGSEDFVCGSQKIKNATSTAIHLSVNGIYRGYFSINNSYRSFVPSLFSKLSKKYDLYLLSGDNDSARDDLSHLFPVEVNMHFNCSPFQKLEKIKQLQAEGRKVIMIGDGLNDAGALREAHVGIAVTQETTQFTPASDAIVQGDALQNLLLWLNQSRQSLNVIRWSFVISLIYNVIGISFAIRGELQPIVAAILMPFSSISVVLFAVWGTRK